MPMRLLLAIMHTTKDMARDLQQHLATDTMDMIDTTMLRMRPTVPKTPSSPRSVLWSSNQVLQAACKVSCLRKHDETID